MGEPYQVGEYPQTEPPRKRQRNEQRPVSSSFGDIINPQWDFPTDHPTYYQQNYDPTYEQPMWSLQAISSRPFYDPVADCGPEYSISTDFSPPFESLDGWSVPSSYESNVHSVPEQLRGNGDYFIPQENFEVLPNYVEPIRSNNSFSSRPLENFAGQLDSGHIYRPKNIGNTAPQVEASAALQDEGDVCFGMVRVSHKAPNLFNADCVLDRKYTCNFKSSTHI